MEIKIISYVELFKENIQKKILSQNLNWQNTTMMVSQLWGKGSLHLDAVSSAYSAFSLCVVHYVIVTYLSASPGVVGQGLCVS